MQIQNFIIFKIRRPLPCWQGMTLDWMVFNSSSGVVEGCDGKSQISRVRSFLLAHEVSVHSPRSLKINKNGFKINKK